MGLDHVMLKVKDWQKAKEYYSSALKPLGYEPIADWGTGGGFGVPGEKTGSLFFSQESQPTRVHVALAASTEQALRDYYTAAINSGGKDNGPPGPRNHVPDGLACFVIDLDNNNVECDYRR